MARTLDFGSKQLGKRPVRKLDPPVRAALRLGAYQLAFTDQADHAVVDDTVELVRAARLERAVPFTNAVMRKLATGLQGLVASLPEGPVKHSYPDWIADIWTRDFGREVALELMRAQNEPPDLEVRSAEPVGEPTDVPAPTSSRASTIGAHAADEPRVTVGRARRRLRGRRPRARPLCGAGREGDDARGRGEPAVEVHPGRAQAMAKNVGPNVRVVIADARELGESGFDRALVDAPCSGLGVLSRRPDLRWRARPLPELQLELLQAAARAPKPGGTIVYSVCTLNADENEAIVRRLGARALSLGAEWPQYAHPTRPEFLLTLSAPRPERVDSSSPD